ncbi:MAG: GPW/gp25 family protein [Selenomonadaceae bacterium]|nr:GPW/gp25 family protein [Selenomonadaceae bacterium]
MEYTLNLDAKEIKIVPASTTEEILQNVRTIILTQLGTVPMYREFGTDNDLIDTPLNVAQNKFLANIAKAILRFEPRAKLKRIRWLKSDAADGELKPLITVEIKE